MSTAALSTPANVDENAQIPDSPDSEKLSSSPNDITLELRGEAKGAIFILLSEGPLNVQIDALHQIGSPTHIQVNSIKELNELHEQLPEKKREMLRYDLEKIAQQVSSN